MDPDMRTLIRAFCEEMAATQAAIREQDPRPALGELIEQSITREINGPEYLQEWENFMVGKLTPILKNNVMIPVAGSVRMFCALGTAAQAIVYLNGRPAYLNHGEYLAPQNAYVFDIPANPGDRVNFAVSFDDSEITAITVEFLRLQVVR